MAHKKAKNGNQCYKDFNKRNGRDIMAGYRIDRTAEDIKREIIAVMKEIKDPRVQGRLLTVVRVEVSNDLSYAKVFISDMQGIDGAKIAVKGLASATGYIRREIGKNLHLRKTPELTFVADDSIEHGMEIVQKLKDITTGSESDDY